MNTKAIEACRAAAEWWDGLRDSHRQSVKNSAPLTVGMWERTADEPMFVALSRAALAEEPPVYLFGPGFQTIHGPRIGPELTTHLELALRNDPPVGG